MISQLITRMGPLLNKLVPAQLAAKGLSKLHPKLGSFIQTASSAGYTIDETLDFLRDRFETTGRKSEKNRLQQGASQGTLRPDEMSGLQKFESFKGGIAAPLAGGLAAGGLAAREPKSPQNDVLQADEIDYAPPPAGKNMTAQIGYNRPELEYNPHDKRPGIPANNEAQITPPPPEGKYPPAQAQNNYSPDFLKHLRALITNKTVDKEDRETIDNFWKYWNATEGQKRSSPFVEFEKFRSGTSDWLKNQGQSQGGRGQGQQQLMQILQTINQSLGNNQ